ncbi:MAG TPA: hypothetical protein VE261_06040 [Gaiellaceae bacterium]|nr:hypothetical protein [Gaiellaceae bacterium]
MKDRKARPLKAGMTRTRSFPCPDELWREVELFAERNDLGAPAAAARLLLRSGLRAESEAKEANAGRAWQIEHAWAELKAVAAGEVEAVGWSEIDKAAERARARARERVREQQRVARNT